MPTRPGIAPSLVVGREAMRLLDERTIASGVPSLQLMERAGQLIAEVFMAPESFNAPPRLVRACRGERRLLVLAGSGNNGGDGSVVARLLAEEGWQATVALVAGEPRPGGDAAANLERWRTGEGRVIDAEAALRDLSGDGAPDYDVVLDAMLGTGLDREVRAELARVMDALAASELPVIAADIASGLCADTGQPLGSAVRADLTVTLGAAKPGLFLASGPDHSGRVVVADIGLMDPAACGVDVIGGVMSPATCRPLLVRRRPMTHKGIMGHVLTIGGSPGKSGAVLLSARGALRAGAGLVTMALPAQLATVTDAALAEAMTLRLPNDESGEIAEGAWDSLAGELAAFDVVIIGPGLGTGAGGWEILRNLLSHYDGPVVVDADGINTALNWGSLKELLERRNARGFVDAVFTPHPGEMARMTALSSGGVQDDRLGVARTFCEGHPCTLILKGAASLVTDGMQVAFNTSGNPGMASPGMGDVLTGVVGAFLAAGKTPFEAACLGAYSHGLAADLLQLRLGGAGFLAGEVADALPSALAWLD